MMLDDVFFPSLEASWCSFCFAWLPFLEAYVFQILRLYTCLIHCLGLEKHHLLPYMTV